MARPPKSAVHGGGSARSTAEELAAMIGPSIGAGEMQHQKESSPAPRLVDACLSATSAKKEPGLVYKVAVVSAAFMAAVFMLNSMKLIYEQPDRFRYPLFITACHQVFVMVVSGVFLRLTGRQASDSNDPVGAKSPVTWHSGLQVPAGRRVCPIRAYWRRFVAILAVVGPVAFFGATCIACANTALLYIYPSLHEMIQNLGPLWVIIVGKVVKPKQRHNVMTYVSLVPVFLGGALCITGEIGSFSLLGIAISNFAALSRSLRLVAQERVFQGIEVVGKTSGAGAGGPKAEVIGGASQEEDDEEMPMVTGRERAVEPASASSSELGAEDVRKMDSLTLLYYTAPFNFLLFLTYSIFYEDLFNLHSSEPFSHGKVYRFLTFQLGGSTYFYFFVTGLIASVFNLLAFMQVELVGGFICAMVSQLKTPANILTSWLVFGAPCTYQQMLGVAMVCLGLQAYNKYGATTSSSPPSSSTEERHLSSRAPSG